jgi:hypothetical protein
MGSKKSAPAPAPAPAAATKKEWKRGSWKDGAYKNTSGTTFTKRGGGRVGANVMSNDTRNKVVSQSAGRVAMMRKNENEDIAGQKREGDMVQTKSGWKNRKTGKVDLYYIGEGEGGGN